MLVCMTSIYDVKDIFTSYKGLIKYLHSVMPTLYVYLQSTSHFQNVCTSAQYECTVLCPSIDIALPPFTSCNIKTLQDSMVKH